MERWITDNDLDPRWPVFTRANVGEVFPWPISPLQWTFAGLPCFETGSRDALVRAGSFDREELETDRPLIFNSFGGYAYLNLSLFRVSARRAGLEVDLVDRMYVGDAPGLPPYEPHPDDERPSCAPRIAETMAWVLSTTSLPEVDADKARVALARAGRPPFAAMAGTEILSWARSLQPELRRLFDQHLFISTAAATPMGIVAGVCTELGDPTFTLRLVGGIGAVDSALPSRAMWRLGRVVKASPALTGEFDAGVDGLAARLAKTDEGANFLGELDELLYEHGSRGPNEWECSAPSWEVEPDLVLAAVDRMRLAGDELDPDVQTARMAADRAAVTAEVDAMLSSAPEARAQLANALRAAQLFSAGRERTKTTIVRLINEVRMGFLELGRRGVESGAIESPTSIAMLTIDELGTFVEDPMSLAGVIAERESAHRALFDVEPPFIIHRTVPAPSTWPRRDAVPVDAAGMGSVLQGVPGCPGTARGRARIVLDPSDPRGIEPGDILVAPITDPAWTPLFVTAGAVVVDVGAPLSHAVIVSRELGIPCVVSVRGATQRIADGAILEVDGTNGTVRIVST